MNGVNNIRPAPDSLLVAIADYVTETRNLSEEAYDTARYVLMDALGCGLLALNYPACTTLLGPIVPGTIVPNGARVPGTAFLLDPVQAAFDIGIMIRWLDYNDTWLAAEWGHPSDNLGGILAVAQRPPFTMQEVLTACIKAHEIQGILALENSFNRVGLDHVVLVKIASTAVVTHLLGGTKTDIINALSQAWVDGQSLRTYRHAPNTGSRKSWAAGDATSRAVRLAMITLSGEMGYPSVLSASTWGFYDVLFKGQPFSLPRPFGSYVMENILFKIAYPAEFHAQTAVECALKLYEAIQGQQESIQKIVITTQESAIRIISKTGPLYNPADRDHSLQYMVAVSLLYGTLTAEHYEDKIAADPRIDALRSKMEVIESKKYSQDYLNPDKRSIANSIQIFFQDGHVTDRVEVEYPLGHKRRREEGIPLLWKKFENNVTTRFSQPQFDKIASLFSKPENFANTPVQTFMDLWT